MGLATKITAGLQKAARKLGPLDTRTLYKRVISESGGNVLIDRGVTRTVTDTVFSTQPLFSRVGKRADVLSTSSVLVTPFDYEFSFTPDQMQYTDVTNKTVTLVFKDAQGNEESLELLMSSPIVLGGVEAAVHAIYRSVSR